MAEKRKQDEGEGISAVSRDRDPGKTPEDYQWDGDVDKS